MKYDVVAVDSISLLQTNQKPVKTICAVFCKLAISAKVSLHCCLFACYRLQFVTIPGNWGRFETSRNKAALKSYYQIRSLSRGFKNRLFVIECPVC